MCPMLSLLASGLIAQNIYVNAASSAKISRRRMGTNEYRSLVRIKRVEWEEMLD